MNDVVVNRNVHGECNDQRDDHEDEAGDRQMEDGVASVTSQQDEQDHGRDQRGRQQQPHRSCQVRNHRVANVEKTTPRIDRFHQLDELLYGRDSARELDFLLPDRSVGRDGQGVAWLLAIPWRCRVLNQSNVVREDISGNRTGRVFVARVLIVDSERHARPDRHVVQRDLESVWRNGPQRYGLEVPPTRMDVRDANAGYTRLGRRWKIRPSRRRAEKDDSDGRSGRSARGCRPLVTSRQREAHDHCDRP